MIAAIYARKSTDQGKRRRLLCLQGDSAQNGTGWRARLPAAGPPLR